MKSKYPRLLVGLLTIGMLGAFGSNATATIKTSIADRNAAEIGQIDEIKDIQEISIGDGIAEQKAIDLTISGRRNSISIDGSQISDISRIENIPDFQINGEIAEIAS